MSKGGGTLRDEGPGHGCTGNLVRLPSFIRDRPQRGSEQHAGCLLAVTTGRQPQRRERGQIGLGPSWPQPLRGSLTELPGLRGLTGDICNMGVITPEPTSSQGRGKNGVGRCMKSALT